MPSQNDRLLIITGPTAVGKTELSIEVAEAWGGEILSADSRQIYRGLNIGTAKPDPSQLGRVPHHFIDELDPGESFSAGAFARAAGERIEAIRSRNRIPIVTGGSTLYLQALQFGLANVPPPNLEIRADLQRRIEQGDAADLFLELQTVDPASAATMDKTKTQRLVRALEVYYGTGKPLSSYFTDAPPPRFHYKTIVLNRERQDLYRRIDERVEQMLAAGLIEEVRELLRRGVDPSLNALQTIGYKEPVQYVLGEIGYEAMVEQLKRNTRRYAKRQITWFRRFPSYHWIDATRTDAFWSAVNAVKPRIRGT